MSLTAFKAKLRDLARLYGFDAQCPPAEGRCSYDNGAIHQGRPESLPEILVHDLTSRLANSAQTLNAVGGLHSVVLVG